MLFGIAGQKRMGKDTTAMIIQSFMPNVPICHFAASIKTIVCDVLGVDLAFVDHWKLSDSTPPGHARPVRKLLQELGAVFRRSVSTVWIDALMRQLPEHAIIADVRHANEIEAIKNKGGLVVLVGRSNALNDDSDESEMRLAEPTRWFLEHTVSPVVFVSTIDDLPHFCVEFDVWVRNEGTVHDLKECVEQLLVSVM